MPTDLHDTDVLVLGGGSAGEAVATQLAAAGVDVTVVESRLVGGECPYFACIPSKAMVVAAELRARLRDAHELGASDAPLDPGDGAAAYRIAAARRDEKAVHHDDADHVESLREAGVTLRRGFGRVVGPGRLEVTGHDAGEVAFRRLVLAIGTTAVMPDIPGLQDADPWTYEQAWSATDLPASMLVVGSGAVGLEIAQVHARFGCEVTLIDREQPAGGREEPEVADDVVEALRADGVDVRVGVELTRVEPAEQGGWRATVGEGEEEEEVVVVERIVMAVGMRPELRGLGLEEVGIDPEAPLEVDDRCRVDGRDDLWAIGDISGVAPFTHTANQQAEVAAANLSGGDRRIDARAIPRTVYTRPEIAGAGHTRATAEEAGIDAVAIAFDLADTARGWVDDARAGRLVLLADRADRTLIGASMAAPSAGESIAELALAVQARCTVEDLIDVIHPFPTWSEGFGPAFRQLRDALDG